VNGFLPGRPVGLTVVTLAILMATLFGLPSLGVPVTGNIPEGLPAFEVPTFGMLGIRRVFPIAAGCLLLAYKVFRRPGVLPQSMDTAWMYDRVSRAGAANLMAAFGHGYSRCRRLVTVRRQ